MGFLGLGDKKGSANMKFYLIPLVMGGLCLGLVGLSEVYKKEKSVKPADKYSAKENNTPTSIKLARPGSEVVLSAEAVVKTDTQKSLLRIKGYIKDIEGQNISLKEKVSQLNGVLEAREKELVDLGRENSYLKDELDKAGNAQSELKGQLDSSINAYKEQLSKKEADLSILAAVRIGLQDQITELNRKFLELASVNSYLEKQIIQNQQERSALNTELDKIKEELNRQVVINETLDKKVAELNSSLSAKEQERLNISKKIEETEESRKALEAEISQLKNIREGNEKNINELNAKIGELNTSGESMRYKLSELSDLLTKKELEIGDKQKEVYSLREGLDKANKEKDALALVLGKKEKSLLGLNTTLERMRSQVSSLRLELNTATQRQKKAAAQLNQVAVSAGSTEELNKIILVNKSLQEKMLDIYQEMELLRAEARAQRNKDSRQQEDNVRVRSEPYERRGSGE